MRALPHPALYTAFVAMLLLAGCDQRDPFRPDGSIPAPAAPASASQQVSWSGEDDLRIDGLSEVPAWQETGITIPASTWARVRLQGLLTLARDPAYVGWCQANSDPLGDGCAPQPLGGVWSIKPNGHGGYLGLVWGCRAGNGTVTSYSLQTFGADYAETEFHHPDVCHVVWRRRPYHSSGFAIPNGAPTNKFTVTGPQQLIVSPIWLELRASSTKAAPGVPVTFTASASGPLTPFNHGTGTATIVWAYGENAPAGPWAYGQGLLAACTNQMTCTIVPPGRGRMRVYAKPDRVAMVAASELVWENGCPPGTPNDPLLSSPAVQEGLREMWNLSNVEAPNIVDRHEWGAWITHDATTGEYDLEPWPEGEHIPCQLAFSGLELPANAVAWVHTHPYATTELQRGCEQTHANIDVAYRRGALPGDKAFARRLNAAIPGLGENGYVLDKHGIFKFRASTRDAKTESTYDRCGY